MCDIIGNGWVVIIVLNALQWLVTFILAIVAWFFPREWDFRWKIIVAMSILLVSTCISLVNQYLKAKELKKKLLDTEERYEREALSISERHKKELSDISEKHQALSAEFRKKRTILAKYQAALESVEYAILVATQSEAKNKLDILYEQLQKVKMSMAEKGGDEN